MNAVRGTARHVEDVARRATAHNYGQTVWGTHRVGDARWVLRMSSWPRAQEAAKALRAAGYTAEDCGSCSLDVAFAEDLAEPDHAVCEHSRGCDVVLCYCSNPDLCDGTEQPQCGHHSFLCSVHAHVDCADCAVDAVVERDHAYARDEGWAR